MLSARLPHRTNKTILYITIIPHNATQPDQLVEIASLEIKQPNVSNLAMAAIHNIIVYGRARTINIVVVFIIILESY